MEKKDQNPGQFENPRDTKDQPGQNQQQGQKSDRYFGDEDVPKKGADQNQDQGGFKGDREIGEEDVKQGQGQGQGQDIDPTIKK